MDRWPKNPGLEGVFVILFLLGGYVAFIFFVAYVMPAALGN
jgi:predicted membrane-bound dolichyl-phosphate-mannose-protein mannosyltransferase